MDRNGPTHYGTEPEVHIELMLEFLDLVRRGVKNPRNAYRWLKYKSTKKLPMDINSWYYDRTNAGRYNDDGVHILREDWDNLIVLDACRWDLFKEVSSLPGELRRVETRETGTIRWLEANFEGGRLYDIVYVTANPQFERVRDQHDIAFHDVVNVWREDGWDERLNTVHPETTTEYAKAVAEEYPHKRLLVHYMQPHYPFIPASFEEDKLRPDIDADNSGFWIKLNNGTSTLTTEHVWDAYRQNLEITVPYVRDLMTTLRGRNVVTSDHGNLIGERQFPIPVRFWGHPLGVYADELVSVPWLKYTNGERKSVTRDNPSSGRKAIEDEHIESRLKSLGYNV